MAPFRDGTKCLVRDLCLHLTNFTPQVMGTRGGASELGPRTRVMPVYSARGGYAPSLLDNARGALWLLGAPRPALWHFVFAPNARTSQVGKALRRLRGVPTVQTVASPPRSFAQPQRLLFGDCVVTQSAWTRQRFLDAYQRGGAPPPPISVIPPPAPDLTRPSAAAIQAERDRLGIPAARPLFIYPGDLEVSCGAAFSLKLAEALALASPEAQVMLAYRAKTAYADLLAEQLAARTAPGLVRFERDVPDIHVLLAAATAVIFPVDDLYGKVDLPIVLLEAMSLGTPVLVLDEGPLSELDGASKLGLEPSEWVALLLALIEQEELHGRLASAGRLAIQQKFGGARLASAYEAVYRELLSAERRC